MGAGFVVLREGFEASLIVGIVLAFLNRTGRRDGFVAVWIGVLVAVTVSVGVGIALFAVGAELHGRAEYLWEGSAMLLAAALLTWMIFWMRRQARTLRSDIEGRVQGALGDGSFFALAAVAFVGVLREGVETALFLFSSASGASPLVSSASGVVGLGIALALGYAFYKGSSKLNLRRFFTLTSAVLLVFAGWLLARSIEEFTEAGVLPENEIVVWGSFLLLAVPTLWLFFVPRRRRSVPA